MIVQPFAGYLSDAFGERGLLVALTTVHVLALVALPFVHTVEWLAVLVVALGTRAGAGPVNNAFLVGSLPDDVQGAGYGLLRSVIMAVSATGSVVVGAFADADYFDPAFVFLAVVIAVATVCYVCSLPTRREPGDRRKRWMRSPNYWPTVSSRLSCIFGAYWSMAASMSVSLTSTSVCMSHRGERSKTAPM